MPVQLLCPKRFADDRGWFSETFHARRLAEQGIDNAFCQDNQSLSGPVGTVRGIHFQRPPHMQAKLVRCVSGSLWDLAIDLRAGSPTYGKWVAAMLTAGNGRQLFIPAGFGHAFVTLAANTEVLYKVDDYYAPDCDGGVLWSDPDLGIGWPLPESVTPLLSGKDRKLPKLADWQSPFEYDGRPLRPLPAE
ncbi:MAG TPA: dTDP-4-dehydrorhamnose 3,5-epimerase [Sphingomonas sp.]